MRKLSLRPYHGTVCYFDSLDELRKYYRRVTKEAYPYEDDPNGGRFILLEGSTLVDRVFLMYAANPAALAHEISHVLLKVFDTIGHDPRKGDGEAFCYMMSQLMLEILP